MHIHRCMHSHIQIHAHVYFHVQKHVHIHMHIHVHTDIRTHIHKHIFVAIGQANISATEKKYLRSRAVEEGHGIRSAQVGTEAILADSERLFGEIKTAFGALVGVGVCDGFSSAPGDSTWFGGSCRYAGEARPCSPRRGIARRGHGSSRRAHRRHAFPRRLRRHRGRRRRR